MIDINCEFFTWDYAKDNLQVCLRRKAEDNILKRDFLDLEMYVRVIIDDTRSYSIHHGMFGVSEDTIFTSALDKAKENTFVEDMEKVLKDFGIQVNMPIKEVVLSNKSKQFGAATIIFNDVLADIAKEYDSSFIILPSSIHECIAHIDNDPDMERYAAMVCEVNEKEVAPQEVLSDHAYFYNRETGGIIW